MGSNVLEVIHPTEDWRAEHVSDSCGGPWLLSVHGQPLVSMVENRLDDWGNETFQTKKAHVYRKSGVAVFEGEGVIPSGPETGVWMACRYAGNTARFTVDWSIKKDTPVKKTLECGSMVLHGKWTALTCIPSFEREKLSAGIVRHFDELPLGMVFEREDGFKLEIDTGFDCWRWNAGVECGSAQADVTVQEDSLLFRRSLLTVNSEEPSMPQPRDYRFCWQMSWTPLAREQEDWPPMTALTLLPHGKGIDVSELTEKPAVSLDLCQLGDIPSMHVAANGQTKEACCWESNLTKNVVKRIIRQLAAKSQDGYLEISGGMTPSCCDNGKHVDRPGKTVSHWDLNGITTFAMWARQCLGNGWKVRVRQPAPWDSLPSLQGLFLPNGFSME